MSLALALVAIKLAPVIIRPLLQLEDNRLQPIICVTAQHLAMLDQVVDPFVSIPDFDLSIMTDNQTPTQVALTILSRLEPILQAEQPDWELVQGDTTTIAAVAMAGFYVRGYNWIC